MKSPVIETSRLTLREMTPNDAIALLAVFSDAATMRFYPKPFDLEGMQGWIQWNRNSYRDHGYGLWTLVLRSSGELIGDCGLTNQQVGDISEVEIGYHVRRDLWKRGLATEAAIACRDYGFRVLGRERLVALIHPQNLASRRVAEKVGMTLVQETQRNGQHTCVYAIKRYDAIQISN